FRWDSVRKISRTRRHIFLFIAQYGALVIPRRAFQTGSQWELFYEFCRGKAETPALQ
ncbi:MAG: YcxB family protein, partial [Blastocatellia bacterium]